MATVVPEDDVYVAPKKRALPFKRTVARKQRLSEEPKKPDEDNDLDLFRHSKEVFPEVLREAKEAEEEKDQSQNDRKRRKLSSSSSSDPTHSRKQSTTAGDGSDDDLIMDVKGKGKEIIRPRRSSTPPLPSSAQTILRTPSSNRASPKAASSRRTRSQNQNGSPALPVTITDDSDSDSDAKPPTSLPQQQNDLTNPATRLRPETEPPTELSSPIEILPNPNPFTSPSPPKQPAEADFSEWITKARALQAADDQKAVVKIFISSRLPGCELPVIAQRRLNQGVQLLLDVWVSQKVDVLEELRARDPVFAAAPIAAGRFFLTWKGNKIYGHSTLAALGVRVDARGALRGAHGDGYVRDGLHLEVWTEEAYAEYLENRGKEWALKLGEKEEEDGEYGVDGRGAGAGAGAGGGEAAAAATPKKKGIRVVLKAKEHEALKLTTREETDVEMLIEAFRTQRDIGPEWSVAIYFDGERLEEDALVSEIDVDPDDVNQMEVHVKKAAS
ncbi:hypothetical protein CHGG_04918 [Chaetomium globosum CBS 148.51]|uniref:Ubiquitin-like domain-containing protein n=1 Tax=Chaetomium globosum (strain ATCC 6205 / CBS 148.51 / DSM 1962 / NBRC 6347 / NRRL 1970) TaxID=306901 RepID=Q2GZX8_CHAGB|nr:uncharacterized protein CHGG_04918 [Chaetomium globosum CBS 148.51]EAQ88299.1 hypothetical protein CHGG_04918 [Chaetomium globosum CBS 148.51]